MYILQTDHIVRFGLVKITMIVFEKIETNLDENKTLER